MEKLFNKKITERLKDKKGITLIALIITIIILIILTAVTINNVIGTDLIGFATKAVENYTDAARDEADKVDELVGITDNLGVGKDSIVKAGKIVTEGTETKEGGEGEGGIKYNYTDAEGRHAMIPVGFKVSTKSSEQYIKDGLVIQDNDGNEFVWVPCYYETKPTNAPSDLQEYKKHTYVEEDEWKEIEYTKYNDWTDQATNTSDSYGNVSIKKYGGFYIGRYETGLPEDKQPTSDKLEYDSTITDKNTTTYGKPISKANKFSWNFVSQKTALDVAKNMYDFISTPGCANSYLIDGSAWDTMTNWIGTDDVDVNNSTTYGNYLDNSSNYAGLYAMHMAATPKDSDIYSRWCFAKHFTKGNVQLLGKKRKP